MKLKHITVLIVFVILIVGAALAAPFLLKGKDEQATGNKSDKVSFGKKEEPVKLSISCAGDIIVHSPQLTAQYDSTTGTYDFNNNFKYVKPYIEASDLALCNVETTFGGGKSSGYPNFNSPDALAAAIKNTGWDIGITANNHNMDTGVAGMKRTLEVLRNAGVQTTGTRLPGEKNYVIVPVKGVNVAVVAYTYETPNNGTGKAINGVPVPAEAQDLLNSFDYATLDEDIAGIKKTMDEARAEGAEIVICYFHWGEEYQNSPNDYQLTIARKIADAGADAIFASHPHVVQTVDMLTNETTGKKTPVFYSLGNFISNQRLETLDNRFTEQGIIGQVQFSYSKSEKKILSVTMDVIPTWVDKYRSGGKNIYEVIPLDTNMQNNATLLASGHMRRAEQALSDITGIVGEQYIRRIPPQMDQ